VDVFKDATMRKNDFKPKRTEESRQRPTWLWLSFVIIALTWFLYFLDSDHQVTFDSPTSQPTQHIVPVTATPQPASIAAQWQTTEIVALPINGSTVYTEQIYRNKPIRLFIRGIGRPVISGIGNPVLSPDDYILESENISIYDASANPLLKMYINGQNLIWKSETRTAANGKIDGYAYYNAPSGQLRFSVACNSYYVCKYENGNWFVLLAIQVQH
jgi:hypothetical protein